MRRRRRSDARTACSHTHAPPRFQRCAHAAAPAVASGNFRSATRLTQGAVHSARHLSEDGRKRTGTVCLLPPAAARQRRRRRSREGACCATHKHHALGGIRTCAYCHAHDGVRCALHAAGAAAAARQQRRRGPRSLLPKLSRELKTSAPSRPVNLLLVCLRTGLTTDAARSRALHAQHTTVGGELTLLWAAARGSGAMPAHICWHINLRARRLRTRTATQTHLPPSSSSAAHGGPSCWRVRWVRKG